ncbi:MAG: LysM peptidoglycan-binding domain-containing protein [Firmicutes bacterium]|nr:LysM peptidoglycan-binding domain-containing protein [Bacillota bacterium]
MKKILKRLIDKFKNLKISMSKKEKNLLILLLSAIFIFLVFKFVIDPQTKTLARLEEEKVALSKESLKNNKIMAKNDSVRKQWTELNKDIQALSNKYYSHMEQSVIMQELNAIIDESDLDIPSISFSNPELLNIDEYETESMLISLPFRGDYKGLNEFLSKLRENPKKILVKQLSLSKGNEDLLEGQISIETYSFGNISKLKDAFFYDNKYEPANGEDPFKPFDFFTDSNDSDEELLLSQIDESKRVVVDSLETNEIHFMGTSASITGKVNRFNMSKHGKASIRLEYFISTNFKEERAFLVLDDRDIIFKYPPDSIGIWVYSYGYSPVTIGFRFQDPDGNKIDSELSRGVSWTGWEYISASPPKDINIYPLKLDRVYLELGANRDDYGVILFDRIEASFHKNEEEAQEKQGYTFYVVKPGDTLKSISENIYGTQSKYRNIMVDNGLNEPSELKTGKVLVIRNR